MAFLTALSAEGIFFRPAVRLPPSPAITQPVSPTTKHSFLKKVDHVTYACEKGQAIKWAWYHIEVEGGTLISRIDDVRPDDPDSSMLIWCIDHGSFGSVLIEGIDRARTSQVSAFAQRHGDHSVQHVAFDTTGLDNFRARLEEYGGRWRGDTLVRDDGFGILRQAFGRGYEPGKADENAFPEYVERPRLLEGENGVSAPVTFSQGAGKGFYVQIEDAVDSGDSAELIDLDESMPEGWTLPEPVPRNTRRDEATKSVSEVLRSRALARVPATGIGNRAAAPAHGAAAAPSIRRVRSSAAIVPQALQGVLPHLGGFAHKPSHALAYGALVGGAVLAPSVGVRTALGGLLLLPMALLMRIRSFGRQRLNWPADSTHLVVSTMGGQPMNEYLESLIDAVMRDSTQGDADSVLAAVDAFCWERPTMNLGNVKGEIVDTALRAANPKTAAELGSFLGYSTVRLARIMQHAQGAQHDAPPPRLYSIDPSPISEMSKRVLLSRAGLDGPLVEHVYGYSSEWISAAAAAGVRLDFLLIDHATSLFLPDLLLALQCDLLAPGATVVADNVQTLGAVRRQPRNPTSCAQASSNPPRRTSALAPLAAAQPEYRKYMLEGDGARLFDTTVHSTNFEYSETLPDELLISVLV